MNKGDIRFLDWQRMLIGETPPVFLLEVFIRSLIIYIFLIYTLRWLGKRMSGQLTIMELSVMLTLGAIVSASMQLPDHGILEGILLLLCALAFQRGISYLGVINSGFENLTQGNVGILVKDGVLQLKQLKELRVSRQQIFAQLRNKGIYNLGQVERMYLEAGGMYSVFTAAEAKPGLSVFPPDDKQIGSIQTENSELLACQSCGKVQQKDSTNCRDCNCDEWTRAVI